jgi:hypothetical protein
MNGDAEAFKQTQGFYIYVNGEVPKAGVAEAPKVETPKAEAPKTAPKVEEKKTEAPKVAEKKAEEKPVETPKTPEKQAAVADNTSVKTPEPPAVKETVKEPVKEVAKETPREEEAEVKEPVAAKPKVQKKPAVAKARKAKDPKACRIACYENGDESLDNFFKENMKLTKKERKKVKKSVAILKIQLNVDGSIKKIMVTGADEKFNAMVNGAASAMGNWNPTVKSGVTVKSEVKMMVKYDKAAKAIKPFDIMVTPKLLPKCKCMSDAEMFGD